MRSVAGVLGVLAILTGGDAGSRVAGQQVLSEGTARIHGRVLTFDTGVPVARAQVTASGAGRVYQSPTDDQGRFEITGVVAGRFTVTASKAGYVSTSYGQTALALTPLTFSIDEGATIEQIDIRLFRGGVIVVRVTDDVGRPLPGVNVEALAYRIVDGDSHLVVTSGSAALRTDDRGEYRISGLAPNEYYVRAQVSQQAMAEGVRPSGAGRMFLPTYYPGGASVTDARPLRVEPGQELSASIALVAQRAATVSGRVQASPEGLAAISVSLRPREGPPSGLRMRVEADGRFEARDVVPGDYLLSAQTRVGNSPEFAAQSLTIGSEDVADLVLTLLPGGTLSGRVVFDENAPGPPDNRAFRFATLVPASGTLNLSPGRTTWNADWTFRTTGVFGTYLMRLGPAPGWYLKEILLRGQDVTDTPLEMSGGRQVDGLTIVLTQRFTEVRGAAVDRTRAPVTGFTAFVFSQEPDRWGPQSRFIGTARADLAGKFFVRGLPPGRYFAVAVNGLESSAAYDRRLLTELQKDAVSVSLDEGASQNVTLTLVTRQRQPLMMAR